RRRPGRLDAGVAPPGAPSVSAVPERDAATRARGHAGEDRRIRRFASNLTPASAVREDGDVPARPVALVTAPFRGAGMDTLRSVADVVYDPWIEQVPLRLYDGERLAARLRDEGADVLIVESDFVNGPVFELPLKVIGSCRGDPNNVDIAAAIAAGIPVLRAPGRNADAVAELAIGLMFAVNRWIVPADHDVRSGEVYAGGRIPYQRYRASQLAGRTAG